MNIHEMWDFIEQEVRAGLRNQLVLEDPLGAEVNEKVGLVPPWTVVHGETFPVNAARAIVRHLKQAVENRQRNAKVEG